MVTKIFYPLNHSEKKMNRKKKKIEKRHIYNFKQTKIDEAVFQFNLGVKDLKSINKVNTVQEACAKCFAVHLLRFEILQTK